MATSTNSTNNTNGKTASTKSGLKLWNRASRSRKQKRATNGAAAAVPVVSGNIGTVVSVGEDTTLRVQFQIKHWVKGRLRITIPRLSIDPEYSERLQYRIMACLLYTSPSPRD